MMQMHALEDLFDLSTLESLPALDDTLFLAALDGDRAPYPARTWFSALAATGQAPH